MDTKGMLRSAALHQRPLFGAAPRRSWLPSVRPRICTPSVIVPSKDNAPGSSGKVPMLWTYSDDLDSLGVLQHKKDVLEEVYNRDVYEANSAPSTIHPSTQQQADLDAALLSERIASAALASTSAPATITANAASAVAANGVATLRDRQHHPNQQQSTSSYTSTVTFRHHHSPDSESQQHFQQQQQHANLQHHQSLNPTHPSSSSSGISSSSTTARLPTDPLSQLPVPQGQPTSQPQQQLGAAAAATPSPGTPAAAGVLGKDGSSSTGSSSSNASASTGGTATVAAAAAAGEPSPQPPATVDDGSIPGSIWVLCCISAALTCASCVFNTALPIYMVSELKMSMKSMGMFEGLLEAFSYIVRMCSGVVSDRMTSRKAAITLGFAAGAAAKFGMAGAGTVGLLFGGKAIDRLANGIQAAPRDALIGDLSPPTVRSACFGLAQSLRKWGSAVGALSAFFLMKASNNNYQLIFYSASTVSLIACLAFVLFVPAHTREQPPLKVAAVAPSGAAAAAAAGSSSAASTAAAAAATSGGGGFVSGVADFLRSVVSMGVDFYRMLGVICLYGMGHVNESLLEARAMEVGFGKAEATLVVAALAAVTFLTAFPLGKLDDKYGPGTTFAVGISALIAGDLVLLLSGRHPLALFASCIFLGVHWAVIQGPLLSIVSGLAPANLRGTAFGIFYTVMAFTAVAANTMYGTIWHTFGANAAFMTSAALMSLVLVALPYMLPASAKKQGSAHAAAAAPSIVPSLPVAARGLLGPAPSVMPAAA